MKKTSFHARSKALVTPLLLSTLALGFSTMASAGSDVTASIPGSCYLYGNIEVCYGTMAGVRNQASEPARSAAFGYTSNGVSYFTMIYNNTSYYCVAPSSMNDIIKTAMASSGYFYIQYNVNTGACTYLALEAGSSEKNPNNL